MAKKLKGIEKEMYKLYEESLKPFTAEQIQDFFEEIDDYMKDATEGCLGLDFIYNYQQLLQTKHRIVEAVVMIQSKNADPSWFYHGKDYILDAEARIGKIKYPITDIPKTCAFWRCTEETGYYHCELQNIYVAVIANNTRDDEDYDADKDYAIVTWFTNEEMHYLDYLEDHNFDMVKEFISDISAIITANPIKRIKDMPEDEVFKEFIAKLTKNINPLPSKSVDDKKETGDDANDCDNAPIQNVSVEADPCPDTDTTNDIVATDKSVMV